MRFGHRHQRAKRNHLALTIARFESRDILGMFTKLRIGLRNDFVRAAKVS